MTEYAQSYTTFSISSILRKFLQMTHLSWVEASELYNGRSSNNPSNCVSLIIADASTGWYERVFASTHFQVNVGEIDICVAAQLWLDLLSCSLDVDDFVNEHVTKKAVSKNIQLCAQQRKMRGSEAFNAVRYKNEDEGETEGIERRRRRREREK